MSPHTVCNLWVIWFIGSLCFLDRQTLVWLPKSRWHQRPIHISPFYIIDYIDYILRHWIVERACQMSVASDVVVWLFLGESDEYIWTSTDFIALFIRWKWWQDLAEAGIIIGWSFAEQGWSWFHWFHWRKLSKALFSERIWSYICVQILPLMLVVSINRYMWSLLIFNACIVLVFQTDTLLFSSEPANPNCSKSCGAHCCHLWTSRALWAASTGWPLPLIERKKKSCSLLATTARCRFSTAVDSFIVSRTHNQALV